MPHVAHNTAVMSSTPGAAGHAVLPPHPLHCFSLSHTGCRGLGLASRTVCPSVQNVPRPPEHAREGQHQSPKHPWPWPAPRHHPRSTPRRAQPGSTHLARLQHPPPARQLHLVHVIAVLVIKGGHGQPLLVVAALLGSSAQGRQLLICSRGSRGDRGCPLASDRGCLARYAASQAACGCRAVHPWCSLSTFAVASCRSALPRCRQTQRASQGAGSGAQRRGALNRDALDCNDLDAGGRVGPSL